MNREKISQKEQKASKKKGKLDKKKVKKSFSLIFYGALIGFVNGFFGGGGGMVCVPVLERFLKYPTKNAHATAISIMLPISIVSSIVYVFSAKIPSMSLLIISSGVFVGGICGAFLLKVLPAKVVGVVFSVVMVVAGVRLLI